ncbi:unnamed protein product [Ciceribacter sp. T2.26MG-112.2]|nr:unnamed protein product [Ciceribacter naphthalenivorans]
MVEMVLDQRALGVADCLFDGIQLLRDVETRFSCLDHGGDTPQMAFGTLEALDDIGMRFVSMLAHGQFLSPWRGYFNRLSCSRHQSEQPRWP